MALPSEGSTIVRSAKQLGQIFAGDEIVVAVQVRYIALSREVVVEPGLCLGLGDKVGAVLRIADERPAPSEGLARVTSAGEPESSKTTGSPQQLPRRAVGASAVDLQEGCLPMHKLCQCVPVHSA